MNGAGDAAPLGSGGAPRRWRFIAFVLLVAGATWIGQTVVQRWHKGLEEDRIVYRALGHARAAARLTEAGRGARSPHLVAYGNAVGQSAPDVARMVVIAVGDEDAFGVRRDPETLWALDGKTGPIQDMDLAVADKSNYLAVLFEDEQQEPKPVREHLLRLFDWSPELGVAELDELRSAQALRDAREDNAIPLGWLLHTLSELPDEARKGLEGPDRNQAERVPLRLVILGIAVDATSHVLDAKMRLPSASLPLRQLVEIAFDGEGGISVAAYAPVVVDGKMRGLAAALIRAPEPQSELPSALWLLAALVVMVFGLGIVLLPDHRHIVAGGVLLALVIVLAFWIPRETSNAVREHLALRAADWIDVQAMADTREPVALLAPLADRELWSADGALRLERSPSDAGVVAITAGGDRAGNATSSIHVHPDTIAALMGEADPDVAGWALGACLLLFFLLGPAAKILHNIRRDPSVYAYVSPAVLGLLVLVFFPFVTGVGLAFYRYHLEGNAYELIGFGNFAEIIAPDDTSGVVFWRTLGVTVLWTTINVVLHVTIGLALAMVLSRPKLRGKGLYRVLLILPWAIPSYITALLWRAMFIGEDGPVNQLLGFFGSEPVSWFDDNFLTNFIPNVVTNTWLGFPFMMVVCLGALQSIPADLYEAAQLDGASAWQRFRHVTLPLLRPALLPAIILGMIWTFNLFNVIYLVSMGQGNTEILITEAYRQFHEQHRHGYAAAYSVLIFLILLIYSWMTTRVTRATDGGYEQ